MEQAQPGRPAAHRDRSADPRSVDQGGHGVPGPASPPCPALSGIDAAYPDYAEFFGTDGAYSTYGLAVSGQWKTAVNSAQRHAHGVARSSTAAPGRWSTRSTSTGAVYYGDNSNPGDINETAQFAIAADLVWQWSGDNAVLSRQLQVHRRRASTTWPAWIRARRTCGRSATASWRTPPSAIEALDVASETIQALGALHDMAVAMGDTATASWARPARAAMLTAFGQWWISSQHLYADSICDSRLGRHRCTAAGQQLQQRYWTSVAPMEQDVAPVADAAPRSANWRRPTFTGSCGLYVDGVGGPEGTGGQTCYLVNTGALAVAEANYGRLPQAVTDMDKVASQLTVEMPGSLPELAASAQYNPFEAFTSRANVMQAWSVLRAAVDRGQRPAGRQPRRAGPFGRRGPRDPVLVAGHVGREPARGDGHAGRDRQPPRRRLPDRGDRRAGPGPDHRHGAGGGRDGALGHPERRARGLPAGDHAPRDRGRGHGAPSRRRRSARRAGVTAQSDMNSG